MNRKRNTVWLPFGGGLTPEQEAQIDGALQTDGSNQMVDSYTIDGTVPKAVVTAEVMTTTSPLKYDYISDWQGGSGENMGVVMGMTSKFIIVGSPYVGRVALLDHENNHIRDLPVKGSSGFGGQIATNKNDEFVIGSSDIVTKYNSAGIEELELDVTGMASFHYEVLENIKMTNTHIVVGRGDDTNFFRLFAIQGVIVGDFTPSTGLSFVGLALSMSDSFIAVTAKLGSEYVVYLYNIPDMTTPKELIYDASTGTNYGWGHRTYIDEDNSTVYISGRGSKLSYYSTSGTLGGLVDIPISLSNNVFGVHMDTTLNYLIASDNGEADAIGYISFIDRSTKIIARTEVKDSTSEGWQGFGKTFGHYGGKLAVGFPGKTGTGFVELYEIGDSLELLDALYHKAREAEVDEALIALANPTVETLESLPTYNIDLSRHTHILNLGQNSTLGAPENIKIGEEGTIVVYQDTVAPDKTLSFDSIFEKLSPMDDTDLNTAPQWLKIGATAVLSYRVIALDWIQLTLQYQGVKNG